MYSIGQTVIDIDSGLPAKIIAVFPPEDGYGACYTIDPPHIDGNVYLDGGRCEFEIALPHETAKIAAGSGN